MTALQAIKEKCLDCCCGNVAEVRRCEILKCPLYDFRTGHKPKVVDENKPRRQISAEHLAKLQAAREKRLNKA